MSQLTRPEATIAGPGSARTVDELLAQARGMLPHRPSPDEALRAQASGALLVDICGDDQRRDGLIPGAPGDPPQLPGMALRPHLPVEAPRHHPPGPPLQRIVTCRDRRAELTVGFRLIAGAPLLAQLRGLSSSRRCPMTTAAPSTALATIQPASTDAERFALAGFLAGYRGLTRDAYALDLRQFTTWCRTRTLPLFAVRRADIEGFARELEARGRARSSVT